MTKSQGATTISSFPLVHRPAKNPIQTIRTFHSLLVRRRKRKEPYHPYPPTPLSHWLVHPSRWVLGNPHPLLLSPRSLHGPLLNRSLFPTPTFPPLLARPLLCVIDLRPLCRIHCLTLRRKRTRGTGWPSTIYLLAQGLQGPVSLLRLSSIPPLYLPSQRVRALHQGKQQVLQEQARSPPHRSCVIFERKLLRSCLVE